MPLEVLKQGVIAFLCEDVLSAATLSSCVLSHTELLRSEPVSPTASDKTAVACTAELQGSLFLSSFRPD